MKKLLDKLHMGDNLTQLTWTFRKVPRDKNNNQEGGREDYSRLKETKQT